jgi:hypothetical protein
MWLVAWLLVFGLGLAALGLTGGPRHQRRDHFWLRLVAVPVVPAGVSAVASAFAPIWKMHAVITGQWLLVIPALILVPILLYRPAGPPPGPSGDDDGGARPEPSPPAPPRPDGGIPLPDAEQSRTRVRDHSRPRLTERGPRRPTREPSRTPHRVPVR